MSTKKKGMQIDLVDKLLIFGNAEIVMDLRTWDFQVHGSLRQLIDRIMELFEQTG